MAYEFFAKLNKIKSFLCLIRYDGNTFERIDSTTGITSVVSLHVDSKDRLWIGNNDNF